MPNNASTDLVSRPAAYEAWRASELGQITDRLEEELILTMLGTISGKRVLDVGCGDGVLSVRLAREGAYVTGLDADPRMLTAARDRASKSRAPVEYIEGDLRALPFPDGTFDVLVAVTLDRSRTHASHAHPRLYLWHPLGACARSRGTSQSRLSMVLPVSTRRIFIKAPMLPSLALPGRRSLGRNAPN